MSDQAILRGIKSTMSTDVFSLLALENIGKSIKNWSGIFNKGVDGISVTKLKNVCDIKFLGYVEQQYIMRRRKNRRRNTYWKYVGAP